MALREDLERQGNWLFKWRSYLPILCLPILLVALATPEFFQLNFGDKAGKAWKLFSLLVALTGLALRGLTAGYVPRGTSGRNTQSQVAETLNTTGMYSIVRNPLYLGNFVINLGVALSIQVWWLVVLLCFGFWLYYERIIFAEEEFLRGKFKETFLKWAETTPVFWPNFRLWKSPAMGFSFKTVLRREFTTFFGIICAFVFLGMAQDLLSAGKIESSLAWLIVFVVNLFLYLFMLVLKKKTKILEVSGR